MSISVWFYGNLDCTSKRMNNHELYILDQLQSHYPELEPDLKQEIAKHALIREVKAGEVLMKTGQFIRSTMLLTRGRIKVYKESGDGAEFFMYYIEPGKACAFSMICASKQEQSEIMAVAVEDSELILIPLNLMEGLMSGYQSWYRFVVETYRSRFDELLNLIDNTVFKGLDERLEFYLNNQSKSFKTKSLKITHEEIAKDLGTSRVVVSRLLKNMEQRGLVALHRNQIDLEFPGM